jgi:hypothetical protein
MNQYYSISQDINYMIQEWEQGKEALNYIFETKVAEPGKTSQRKVKKRIADNWWRLAEIGEDMS